MFAAARALGAGARPFVAQGARRAQAPVRQMSTLKTLYSTVFRSNITYLTYVFVGAIALDTVYSKGVDTAWEIANSGKLYHQIDWSKWRFHLDEEEEEEEEESEE